MQRRKMAVATASERDHVEAAPRRCDMEKYFDGILTCAEVGSGRTSRKFSAPA